MDEDAEYRAWQGLAAAIVFMERRRGYERLMAFANQRINAVSQVYYYPCPPQRMITYSEIHSPPNNLFGSLASQLLSGW